jgi:hypothetical protein
MRTWSSSARGGRAERIEALLKLALELVGAHELETTPTGGRVPLMPS